MNITNEQIEAWKAKYGDVFKANSGEETAYFRKPTRVELSYAMTLQQQNKTLEFLEHLFKSCFIDGSRAFIEKTDYMLGAASLAEKLVEVKQVEVKKL